VKVLREVTEEEVYETRQISDLKYIMPEKDKREIEDKLKKPIPAGSNQPANNGAAGVISP
jgi:hypothetical protein